ncbi:MAG: NlpC/P60 family protein [Paludibacteraceae bacterium]
MKKILFLIIQVQFISFSVFSQNADIEKIINSVKENYVPDKRISVYDVYTQKSNNSIVIKGKISDSDVYKKLLQSAKNEGIAFVDSIKLLPENTIGEKHWSVVPLSAVYIRSKPDFAAEIITQALLGTPVKVLDKKGGWLLIQTPDQYIGWTSTDLKMIDRNELSLYNKRTKVIVTDNNTIVYENASDESQRIMEVLMGNILTLEDNKTGRKFTQISFPDGRKGYISSKSIKTLSDWQKSFQLNGENIIKTAKLFLGLPYFWGGTSSRGVDCSGFTKTVYFMYGLILQRDASQQFYCGENVDISESFDKLQKGDLLFFGRKTASDPVKYNVVHVAIYMGDKRFIHSSGEVRINSLDANRFDYDEYNYKRLIGARRIIGTTMKNISNVFHNEWYN